MVQRAARENREAYGWFAGRDGETRLGACALGLAVVSGVLALVPGLPFDTRWCAVLASACLNILIAVLGTRLYAGRITSTSAERVPLWKTLLGLARLAFRHDAGKGKHKDKHQGKGDDSGDVEPPQPDAIHADFPDVHALLRSLPWQPCAAPLLALVSLGFVMLAWLRPAFESNAVNAQASLFVALAGALALAFGVLLAERVHAHHAEHPAAAHSLAALLRVLLVAALGAAASIALTAYAGVSPTWLVRLVAVLSGAVAVELAARAAWAWFSAPAPQGDETWTLSSTIAQTLRPHARPLAALDAQLRARYGIDLRQNWALQSFARLLPGTLAAMLLAAWLLGGVTILGPDQRAVYERFGAPAAVWQPGLHVGLPWPFGRARVIDNGAIHQLIVSGSAGDDINASQPAVAAVPADARTPAQLDRLWDVAHPWETTQVIAGTSGDQQAFQIVSADVRLDYRIGLSDAAARAALYRAVDLDQTVRSIANREVVRYLASRTLPALLDTPQTAMAATLRGVVQHELDRAIGGIEVVAVVIESVHPPAGAAAAYHGVQAAQIRAEASVVQARGFAAATVGGAQRQAIEAIAQGSANGADALAAARVQQAAFDADVIAQGLGGPAFAFEYYLHALQKGLQNANLTVIDDRLASGGRATFDLRPLAPATARGVRPAW
ncbi:MAG TPA: SPFH domain-containing protein [Paraburkholderia sp.]|jgi:regulator of protease activity HflC (stomatin/prohibitin superfamily)|uniref:SPFH domain-containing protein n=1 Tax=Paraburkholderia sp. TaxID=1926495 RepID=UPI002DEEBB8B|nr:SPFH domain-containing protein [Paraburkholderia sp.]